MKWILLTMTGLTISWIIAMLLLNVSCDRKDSVVIDSVMHSFIDCIECKESNRKQVNILNAKGEVICSYSEVLFVEDTTLLNHSKIPEP